MTNLSGDRKLPKCQRDVPFRQKDVSLYAQRCAGALVCGAAPGCCSSIAANVSPARPRESCCLTLTEVELRGNAEAELPFATCFVLALMRI